MGNDWRSETPPADRLLKLYDFGNQKFETIAQSITDFKVSSKSETLVYRAGIRLRVLPVTTESHSKNRNKPGKPNRDNGWIDLTRIKVSINPRAEWKQMFNEMWRLQSQHFWVENMSGVDLSLIHI